MARRVHSPYPALAQLSLWSFRQHCLFFVVHLDLVRGRRTARLLELTDIIGRVGHLVSFRSFVVCWEGVKWEQVAVWTQGPDGEDATCLLLSPSIPRMVINLEYQDIIWHFGRLRLIGRFEVLHHVPNLVRRLQNTARNTEI